MSATRPPSSPFAPLSGPPSPPPAPPARRFALIALAVCVLGFAVLCILVTQGMTAVPDRWLLVALRTPGTPGDPLGPDWLGEFVLDITNLGGRAVLGLLGLLAAGYLTVLRRWRALVFLLAALLGGMELGDFFKELFARPRPDVVPHLARESSSSFPSGHATYSAIAYVTFAIMLRGLAPGAAGRAYIAGAAAFVVLLVGFSRVYLGVHYPSDVLAGWCLGTAWALACWLVTGRLARR